MHKIKYIDHRSVTIPKLTYYKYGLTLPNKKEKDNIINVSDSEKRSLMKQHNGKRPVWEEIKPTRPKPAIIEANEDDNGSR